MQKKKIFFKIISTVMLLALLINSVFLIPQANTDMASNSAILANTDFWDWNTQDPKCLATGANASIDYVYDEVLGRNVIAARLPKGLNGSNSIYVPKVLENGKEYTLYIAYKVSAWSCISYNGATLYDGGKPLDSNGWNSKTYSFTPTNDGCYFRIGTNQIDCTVYIAELRLFETSHIAVATPENGTASVSASLAAVGEKVTFTAVPHTGYSFEHWKDADGNIVSTQAVFEYTVTGDTTLTPIFSGESSVLKYYYEDFEDGELFEGGNTSSSSFVIAASPDGSSDYCFKHNQSSSNKYYYVKTPSLSAGHTYTVSFKCYSVSEAKWFRFDIYDSTAAHTSDSRKGIWTTADKWTECSYDITPTADGWYVGYLMSNEIYIDDFKIVNKSFPNYSEDIIADFIKGYETADNACKAFYGAITEDKKNGALTSLSKTYWSAICSDGNDLTACSAKGQGAYNVIGSDGSKQVPDSEHFGYTYDGFGITAYKSDDFSVEAVGNAVSAPQEGILLSVDANFTKVVGISYTAPLEGLVKLGGKNASSVVLVKSINKLETAHPASAEQYVNVAVYKNNSVVGNIKTVLNAENGYIDLSCIEKFRVNKGDNISIVFEAVDGAFTVATDMAVSYVDADMGDANIDGFIDIRDIVKVKKSISYIDGYTFSSDTNYDDKIDIFDLVLMRKYLLGAIDIFPIGGVNPQAVTLSLYDETSYGITWNTNGKPGEPVVRISKGERFDSKSFREIKAEYTIEYTFLKSGEKKTEYYVLKAVVNGLESGETYTYNCCDLKYGSCSENFTFTVKERDASSFKFIHVSDSQTSASSYLDPLEDGNGSGWAYNDTWTAIKKNGMNMDFVLHTGDIVEWSKYESYWRNMINFNSKYFASIPNMPLSGNHESTYRNGEYEIYKHFNMKLSEQNTALGVYYSFDYGNAKFIMLDTNNLSNNMIKQEQYDWLVDTLKNNKQKWIIVSMHNPMYSVGQWGSDPSKNTISLALRSQLSDLFAEYGVDLVLQGHDHTYSKTYPIGMNGAVNTELVYETVSGVPCCTNANGVIYAVNGASGNQGRSVVNADAGIYELYSNAKNSSWSEIEVTQDTLIVKVYYCYMGTKTPVLWEQYGIKK